MAQVKLSGIYDTAYKSSQSFSSTWKNEGNNSLGALVQQILPFTESSQPGQLLIAGNNGNLTGDFPEGYGTTYNQDHKISNLSLGNISRYSSSWSQWNFNNQSSPTYVNYSMVYKYVPWGWSGSTAAGGNPSEDIFQAKECLQKISDVTNYSSINISGSVPEEKSGSWGLPWLSGSLASIGGSDGNPGGTLITAGNVNSYFYHKATTQNGVYIPCGSGSYKVPQENTVESVLFMFWLKVEELPEENAGIWCNSMQLITPGSEDWSPYNGYMCEVTSAGSLMFTRGDDGGTASTNRRRFETEFTINEGKWNFIAVRLHSGSNTTNSTTNFCWAYKDGGRGYSWVNGLTFVDGLGGEVKYRHRYGMVISPGDGDQYFTGGIGHFYMFWEANTGKVGYDKMQETMNTSNSGSANIYYTT